MVENQRKLAHIEKIAKLESIPSYDRVELATILGWQVVVRKNEFKENDLCCYFEIDSKVPETEWSEFLRPKHFKVKTQKMCHSISQGLAVPINAIPELKDKEWKEGDDVTDLIGVKYYVAEDNDRKAKAPNPDLKYNSMAARHKELFKMKPFKWLMRRRWGKKLLFLFFGRKKDKPLGFPTHFPFINKTDETRCENIPWVLQHKEPLTVTEKLDGTSSTYILERKKHKKYEFYVLSRNVRQLNPNQQTYHEKNIYWEMAFKYDIEKHLKEHLERFPELDYVCIQGESVGFVQGNPLKLKENKLFVFNFITSDLGKMDSEQAKTIIESWGMQWVPILDTNYIMPDTMEEFKEYATAKSVVNPNVYREGVVLRDYKTGLSFKNVSREYLLKHNQ